MLKKKDINESFNALKEAVMAEFYYFKEIRKHLDELKDDIAKGKEKEELKEIKQALRDFRYVGRAESHLEKSEKHVEDIVEFAMSSVRITAQGSIQELEELFNRLKVYAAFLVQNSSRYEGEIKKRLEDIESMIKDGKDCSEGLEDLEELVNKVIEWLSATYQTEERLKEAVEKCGIDEDSLIENILRSIRKLHEEQKTILKTQEIFRRVLSVSNKKRREEILFVLFDNLIVEFKKSNNGLVHLKDRVANFNNEEITRIMNKYIKVRTK